MWCCLLISLLSLLKPSFVSWGVALVKAFLGNLLSGIAGGITWELGRLWTQQSRHLPVVAIRTLSRNGVRGDQKCKQHSESPAFPPTGRLASIKVCEHLSHSLRRDQGLKQHRVLGARQPNRCKHLAFLRRSGPDPM